METYPYTIEYYLTATDKKLFKEWVDGLDSVARARIFIRLDKVRLGNLGKNRHVGEGVYENATRAHSPQPAAGSSERMEIVSLHLEDSPLLAAGSFN